MTAGGDVALPTGSAASAVLSFVVAGVLPDGDGAPRMRYRLAGQGYDEARAIAGQVVATAGGIALRFARPPEPVEFILLEPAAIPGRYRILALAVAGNPLEDVARRVLAAVERADEPVESGATSILSVLERPALELDVRGIDWPAGGTLDMVVRRDGDAGPLAAPSGLLERVSEDHRAGQAVLARLGREIADASDGIHELVDAVARLASMQERLDAAAARQERALTLVEELVSRAAADRASADAAAHASRESDRTAASAEHGATLRAISALEARIERLGNAVENVFWRRWLRRLRGGGR